MNKSEFTRAYADRLGVTIKEAENSIAVFIETLTECMLNGEYVHISGFGTFEIKSKPAREGANPKTGEKIQLPASKTPVFKFGKAYKDSFNN